MMEQLRGEPAVVGGFIQASTALVLAFLTKISPEQMAAVWAFSAAASAVVVRALVTPNHRIPPSAP